MDIDDIYALIRSETDNDDDEQVTDTQLGVWLTVEYKKVRRKLSARFPSLFTKTSDPIVVTAQTLTKPTDFEKLGTYGRIERQEGTSWVTIPHASPVNPEGDGYIGHMEQGAAFHLTPASSAPGTYRFVYISSPSSCFPAADIPMGFEDVIIQKVIAKVQRRIGGDPEPHLEEAKETFDETAAALKAGPRLGNAPEPGFVAVNDDSSWCD